MPKTKQQEAQEKRLQRNIRQAKKTRADAKTSGNKTVRTRPPKKGGFFAGLKTDAPQTVQQSIPYKEMYRDGICRLTDKLYTKTVQFFDINYQLAQADDKAQIFEGYCDFLNYFDASIHVQLTFINQRANMQDFARSIDIPIRGDEYDGIRREYGDMLKSQLQKGNNGLTKRKYITFGIEADDLRTAKMRLERIEADVLANFKALGAQAKPLDGLEDVYKRQGFYTAANAGNPKKPISRRARPFSGVTATRQSATASGQPVRNGKPPRSGAATLKRWNG